MTPFIGGNNMVGVRGASDERGVSDVVGVAILVSLSIVGSLAIVAVGGVALSAITDQAEHGLAEDSLRNIDAQLSSLADSPVDSSTTFTFPEGAGEKLKANASAGKVVVTATTAAGYTQHSVNGNTPCSVRQELGTIVHENSNGNEMVYQGGALWAHSPAGTRVESKPNFNFDGSSIRFSFVNISGLDSIGEGEELNAQKLGEKSRAETASIRKQLRPCWRIQGASGTVPVELNVTVHSEYADGWARYAETGMDTTLDPSQVHLDEDANQVTLTFGRIGNTSGVITSDNDFPGSIIYAGLSQYAQYNRNLTARSGGPEFVVNQTQYNRHSIAVYDDDANTWAIQRNTGGGWEYANGSSVAESTLPVATTGSEPVYDIDEETPICVAQGASVGGMLQNKCTQSMVGMTDAGQLNAPSTATFEVTLAQVLGSKVVEEGDSVEVQATVENSGSERATQHVALFDIQGDVVGYTEKTLDPGDSEQVTFSWETTSSDAGTGDLVVASETRGRRISGVEVTDSGAQTANFQVDIRERQTSETATVGDTHTVTATVTNTGLESGTQWVALEDYDGQPVAATEETVAAGDTMTVTLSWTPTEPHPADDVTVASGDSADTYDVEVTSNTAPGGVVYLGKAANADSYFRGGERTVNTAYTETSPNNPGEVCARGNAGPTETFNGGDDLLCGQEGGSDTGYVLDGAASAQYTVYVADTDDGTWDDAARPGPNEDEYHRYVHSGEVGVGSDAAYNFYTVDSETPVCIAERSASTDPSHDCGAIYETDGGFEYNDDSYLEVESETATLSLLTAQIGESVTLNETEVEQTRRPMDIEFVLDRSGSMGGYIGTGEAPNDGDYTVPDSRYYEVDDTVYGPGESVYLEAGTEVGVYDDGSDPFGERIDATRSFIGALNSTAGDTAGAVEFNTYADVLTAPSSDFDAVNQSLAARHDGGTRIDIGLSDGVSELESHGQNQKQTIVLLTDGKNDDSGYTEAQLNEFTLAEADKAARENITVHTIGLGDEANETLLRTVADKTGGNYTYVDDAGDLEEEFVEIAFNETADTRRVIQRDSTTVSTVSDGSVEELSLDGGNVNDPDRFNSSDSRTVGDQLSELNNTDLSFRMTVYGCQDRQYTDETVTNSSTGETYRHTYCANRSSDATTITNESVIGDHVIVTDDNSNTLADIEKTAWWQPDPEDVDAMEPFLDGGDLNLTSTEALVGLRVAEGNQTGYMLLHFNASERETVREEWPGNTGSTATDRSDFQVENVTASPTTVKQGKTTTVTATISNDGSQTATQYVTLGDANSGYIENSTAVTLAPGTQETVELAWNTTEAPTGETTLTAETADDAETVTVTVADEDRATFRVGPLSTTEPVTETDTLNVSARITNTGDATDTQAVYLQKEVGSDWRVVDAIRNVQLRKNGGETDLTLQWETQVGDAGERAVRITTRDTSARTNATVEETETDVDGLVGTVGSNTGDPVDIDVSQIVIEG